MFANLAIIKSMIYSRFPSNCRSSPHRFWLHCLGALLTLSGQGGSRNPTGGARSFLAQWSKNDPQLADGWNGPYFQTLIPSMLGGCYDIEKVKEYQPTISNPAENS
jgi:hypothetical protein